MPDEPNTKAKPPVDVVVTTVTTDEPQPGVTVVVRDIKMSKEARKDLGEGTCSKCGMHSPAYDTRTGLCVFCMVRGGADA